MGQALMVGAVWSAGTLAALLFTAWLSDMRSPASWDTTCARCGRYRKGHYLWTLSLGHQLHLLRRHRKDVAHVG